MTCKNNNRISPIGRTVSNMNSDENAQINELIISSMNREQLERFISVLAEYNMMYNKLKCILFESGLTKTEFAFAIEFQRILLHSHEDNDIAFEYAKQEAKILTGTPENIANSAIYKMDTAEVEREDRLSCNILF